MAKKVVLKQLVKTVSASGTAEALTASKTDVFSASIQSLKGNTGDVYIGTSDVSSSAYGQVLLAAGNAVSIEPPSIAGTQAETFDLSEIYIDVDSNDEGVAVLYWTTDS